MSETIFWISAAGVLFPYFGYPLVLLAAGAVIRRRPPSGAPIFPSITMIVPVHNEAARIDRKIANTAALAAPLDATNRFPDASAANPPPTVPT